MIEATAVYAVASGCPTWSAGSKLSGVMLPSGMIGLAVRLSLALLIGRYIRRETAQEKFPDQIIHGMTRDTDQAIG